MNRQEKARLEYNNGYYADKLTQGIEFQDAATKILWQHGIVIVGYSSRRFQNECGENIMGAEIKRDGHFRNTGNIYIEVSEKAHPDNHSFAPSGIYKKDNQWLFIIGDEETLYIFPTKYLRKLEKRYTAVETPTSTGFLLPLEDAEKYCIKKIEVKNNKN